MGALWVITGPSGAGKTTLTKRLLEDIPKSRQLITCTTRPMRTGEENAVHYNFLSAQEFETGIRNGDFIEWASVYGNYYGSRRVDVIDMLKENDHIFAVVDVQGAEVFSRLFPKAIVLIINSTKEQLRSRLELRNETCDVIARREQEYDNEIARGRKLGEVVMNPDGELEQTLARLHSIVMEQEILPINHPVK